jgi:Tfp pilus assembly protein PilF
MVVIALAVFLLGGCSRKEEAAAPVPVATDTAAAAAAAAKAAREAIESDTAKARALIVGFTGAEDDLVAAKDLLKSVLTRDKDYAPAYVELARLEYMSGYSGAGDRDRTRVLNAGKFLKHARSLDPEVPGAHQLEAWIHLELGAYDLAEESLDHAELSGVAKEELDPIRARIAGAYDNEREALRLAREIVANEASPSALKFEMLTFIGSRLAKQGFRAEAQEAYEQAIEQLPDSAWGYANLAAFHLDHDYVEAGLQNAEKAYAITPASGAALTLARASIMRSEQLYRLKKNREAEQVIEQLTSKVPAGNADIDQMLGDHYYSIFEATSAAAWLDKAIEKYRSVLAADPDRPELARTLDAAIARRGTMPARP